ncbi:MAG: hypothetical protein AB7J40_06410 [Candidatus Altimarinota bacterium]
MEHHSERPDIKISVKERRRDKPRDEFDESHMQYIDEEGYLVTEYDYIKESIYRMKKVIGIFSPSNISAALTSLKAAADVIITDLKDIHTTSKQVMMRGIGTVLDQVEAKPETEAEKTSMQKLRQKMAEFWTREEHLDPIGPDESWGQYLSRRLEWWNTYKKKDYIDPSLRANIH